jgi:hypothetical protein
MAAKKFTHKVTINDRRRKSKQLSDFRKKGVFRKDLRQVFNTYYKDQVRALYQAIYDEK